MKAARNKLKGAFILSINGDLVYTAEDVHRKLKQLRDQGVTEISIDFAPVTKLTAKQQGKAQNEFGLFHPNTKPTIGKTKSHDDEPSILGRKPVKKTGSTPQGKFISQRVAKEFDSKVFFGTVKEQWNDSGVTQWHVLFDDDDEEDLNKRELKKALKLHKRMRHYDPVWKEKKKNATIGRIMANITHTPYEENNQNVIDDLDGSIPSIDMHSLRAISRIRASMMKDKLNSE